MASTFRTLFSPGPFCVVWQANLGVFCGFLGFLILPGLAAIPLGHAARRRIKASEGHLAGRGRAAFALVVGYLVAGFLVWMIGVFVINQRAIHANLAAIDRAKITWAAATGAGEGADPTIEDLSPFLPGKKFPEPAGYEIYEINPIGVKASSTIVAPSYAPTTPRQPPWEASKLPPLPPPTW